MVLKVCSVLAFWTWRCCLLPGTRREKGPRRPGRNSRGLPRLPIRPASRNLEDQQRWCGCCDCHSPLDLLAERFVLAYEEWLQTPSKLWKPVYWPAILWLVPVHLPLYWPAILWLVPVHLPLYWPAILWLVPVHLPLYWPAILWLVPVHLPLYWPAILWLVPVHLPLYWPAILWLVPVHLPLYWPAILWLVPVHLPLYWPAILWLVPVHLFQPSCCHEATSSRLTVSCRSSSKPSLPGSCMYLHFAGSAGRCTDARGLYH